MNRKVKLNSNLQNLGRLRVEACKRENEVLGKAEKEVVLCD